MTVIEKRIGEKLQDQFSPLHLEVVNESYKHAVPANSETHFKVTLVSEHFNDLRQVQRHQAIYRTLAAELAGPVHALALHTYAPEEWRSVTVPESPNCLGGGRR